MRLSAKWKMRCCGAIIVILFNNTIGDAEVMMIRRGLIVGIILAVLAGVFGLAGSGYAGSAVLSEGSVLPELTLPAPASPEKKDYLGIGQQESFTLDQVSGNLLILEVLSALCPECHKSAPVMNRLYNVIAGDPDLSKDIRMLGIATGNSERQLNAYVEKYQVKFPIIADPDETVDRKLGGAGTPTLMVVDNSSKIRYIHQGRVEDLDSLLEIIRAIHE